MGKDTKEELKGYAQRLRLFREERGLSQEQVAEDIMISYNAYKKLENGQIALSTRYLCRLNAAYGVSTDKILFGEIKSSKIKKKEIIRNCSERDKMCLLLTLSDMRKKNKRTGMKNEEDSYFRDKRGR